MCDAVCCVRHRDGTGAEVSDDAGREAEILLSAAQREKYGRGTVKNALIREKDKICRLCGMQEQAY